MRLVLLIVGGVAIGAGSVSGVRTILPQGGSMFDAVRALGGNPGSFRLGDINLNPLKAYEDVKRQITSGSVRAPFNVGSAPTPSVSNIGQISFNNSLHFDDAAFKRAAAAGINARIQQDIRRSQDLAAYARNPMGWHGMPPH
jgi:hypothetical protein